MELSPDNQKNWLRVAQPWAHLRKFTAARIALGRSGGSLTTPAVLDFRVSHAQARDAVHAEFDAGAFVAQLAGRGIESEVLSSAVTGRREYLLRPDLGRRLSRDSAEYLRDQAAVWGARDLAIIVSDGLAAQAAQKHAAETVAGIFDLLGGLGWSLYPVFVVPFARVKIQDEIGVLLGARQTLILLGERPGLGAPDSLGAYFTYAPSPDKTDADRNCISNIRDRGLPPADAARKIAALLAKSAEEKRSGVALKDQGELLGAASALGAGCSGPV